jgi:uncharacterized protein YerC
MEKQNVVTVTDYDEVRFAANNKRLQRIIEMRRARAAYSTIAKEFGISTERVRQIVKKYNEKSIEPVVFKNKRPPSAQVAKRRQKIAKMRHEGKTYTAISKKLGISICIIMQDIRFYNASHPEDAVGALRKPTYVSFSDTDIKKIVELRKSGMSIHRIASMYQVYDMRIYRILKDAEESGVY